VLQGLLERLPIEIAGLKGGSARNAIPREASAVIVLDSAREKELRSLLADFQGQIQSDLGGFDPGLQVSLEKAEGASQVMEKTDAQRTVDVLASLHHGVLAMSPDIAGLVQTSTNLATVGIKDGMVEIGTSQRSAIESSKQAAARMVATVCRLAGFEVEQGAGYPGWKPDPNSEIVQKLQTVHQELFGKPAKLIAMHAGLECGVIGEKYPGMQMVSFGPTIVDPHSPNERVQISTVQAFWNYLRAVLERL
jgi:dipeptidase D